MKTSNLEDKKVARNKYIWETYIYVKKNVEIFLGDRDRDVLTRDHDYMIRPPIDVCLSADQASCETAEIPR